MHRKTKYMALAAAGGTAALALTAAPALASSDTASKAITGPESAYGVIYGKRATANIPTIPLTWHGLVNTHGVFSGGGHAPKKGQEHKFTTSAGNLTVAITASPASSQTFNVKTCYFSATTYVVFTTVGSQSTGKFAGTSGPGAVRAYFAGYMPRYKSGPKKGQCNTSPNAPELAKGAVVSLLLSIVLTTP